MDKNDCIRHLDEFTDGIEVKLKDKHYAKLNERWADYKENSKRG